MNARMEPRDGGGRAVLLELCAVPCCLANA